jgi:carbonic anhydrase
LGSSTRRVNRSDNGGWLDGAVPQTMTPAQAWAALTEGNERFVNGDRDHPNQDAHRRAQVAAEQNPFALLFGCSDSRVAAEIIFDRGLGDLFVVRTAGHVVDDAVLGSIEFGVGVLGIPLIVVLGHDSCGAVRATVEAHDNGTRPEGHIGRIVDLVLPSLELDVSPSRPTIDELVARHTSHTARELVTLSPVIADAIAAGTCAVVGATYALSDGRVRPIEYVGRIDALP